MTAPNVTLDEMIESASAEVKYWEAQSADTMDEQCFAMARATLATLQSLKDAGDGVTEPESWMMVEYLVDGETRKPCHLRVVSQLAYDTLLSARNRVCVQRDEFRRDAGRYRHLRDKGINGYPGNELVVYQGCMSDKSLLPDELDAAIDAAAGKGEE